MSCARKCVMDRQTDGQMRPNTIVAVLPLWAKASNNDLAIACKPKKPANSPSQCTSIILTYPKFE